MKDPRAPVIVVLALLTAGSGLGLWYQGRELADLSAQLASARHELTQKAAERQLLETRWKEAQAKVAQLQAAAAAQRRVSASPANVRNITPDVIRQWLADADDPAVLRRLNTQARNQTLRHYAELLKALNLPPAQNEAFIKLLTEKRQASMDTAVAEYHQGVDPTADLDAFQEAIFVARADDKNQIGQLLGPAAYAQYQAFDRAAAQGNVVSNLQMSLSGTPHPLTPEQSASLTAVMASDGTGHITTKVLSAAAAFLSPAQLQALQDLQALALSASQQRSQPGRALPTGAPAR